MNSRGSPTPAFFIAIAAGVLLATVTNVQARQSTAVPGAASSPQASPAAILPSPAARPLGLHAVTNASLTYVSQNASGPGRIGPESIGFINGSPLAPNTPYDLFSSAPQVSGDAGVGQLLTTGDFATRAFDMSLTAGLASVRGSVTTASYWAENLLPTLNPHVGSQALPYSVAFPSHPGQDDGGATRLSVVSGRLATADGNLTLRAGWFDLAQTDRFVFAQPALTNVNPAIAYAPAETLSNGLAGIDRWQPFSSALPLHGIDVVGKRKTATLEIASADLPGLPGEKARMSMASLVFDAGNGTRFSGQIVHARTSGAPFLATIPFGDTPQFLLSPQGLLPSSVLSGQRQTIAGVRGAFPVVRALQLDGVVEIGRAWYDAAYVVRPGTAAPGGYYHAGIIRTRGRTLASLDCYRMEPRYATMILPYGVPENQWSVAFAWPGQWLKSNYQLIDNSVLGVNRQGYRLRYFVDKGPLEVHLEYTDVRQIEAETIESAQQTGFVDGYFLPQTPAAATFGRQKRSALWAAWHPSLGDLSIDVVDDTEYRPFVIAHPEDRVSYEVPQVMLTFSRHLSPTVEVAAGVGRYAMKGAFSERIDYAQRLIFAGVEIAQTPRTELLLSFRRSTFRGVTTYPLRPDSPNFAASALIVEQRLHL